MSVNTVEGRQQGFTLVELAIVLVIVGLLIGGILKGQELIASTRMTSTASQIRAVEAATNNFFDTYGNMPGDLPNATGRLPNCATAASICIFAGNGDGRIAVTPDAAYAAGTEGSAFFGHLAAADLISGVLPQATAVTPGQGALGTPLGNASYYRVGYQGAGNGAAAVGNMTPGHYLTLSSLGAGTAVLATNFEGAGIQPKAAQKIDSKYDDGAPQTGSVIGANTTAATATAGCDNAGVYNSQNTDIDCGLYIRFYQ